VNLAGRTAVVTGAGGGIGRALAVSLAQRGCHLALADIDAVGLAQTGALLAEHGDAGHGVAEHGVAEHGVAGHGVAEHGVAGHGVADHGVEVSLHALDVADRAAVAALPAAVAQRHAKVDLLFNNAGVALGGNFAQISDADFEWLFEINFWGVVRMTRAFLPVLARSDAARIVNLSSLFGLISPPGQTAYSASKFAVRGFSNALRYELQGSTIGLTVVHPGGVATSIARHARKPADVSAAEAEQALARFEKMLRMPPEKAAEIIVAGVARGKARILVGVDAKFCALIERLMPVSYWNLLGRGVR
jgi:short-subunit dehydrogenase